MKKAYVIKNIYSGKYISYIYGRDIATPFEEMEENGFHYSRKQAEESLALSFKQNEGDKNIYTIEILYYN